MQIAINQTQRPYMRHPATSPGTANQQHGGTAPESKREAATPDLLAAVGACLPSCSVIITTAD